MKLNGSKSTKLPLKKFNKEILVTKKPSYIHLSNAYAQLPAFSADPPDPNHIELTVPPTQTSPATDASQAPTTAPTAASKPIPSRFKRKATKRFLARQLKRTENAQEAALIKDYITWTEDELTALAK